MTGLNEKTLILRVNGSHPMKFSYWLDGWHSCGVDDDGSKGYGIAVDVSSVFDTFEASGGGVMPDSHVIKLHKFLGEYIESRKNVEYPD